MSAKAGFGGALRSELTKIRSVRSTYWALVTAVLVTAVPGVLTVTSEYGAVVPGTGATEGRVH